MEFEFRMNLDDAKIIKQLDKGRFIFFRKMVEAADKDILKGRIVVFE